MPLHSWLPRAHPIAPAPVSALMSGVMIKVAIYGLVRVLVDWLGPSADLVRRARARARRALGGRRRHLRALPARPEAAARVPLDRERRDHRARARRLPAPACPGRRHVGGDRAGGGAAAHAQSRGLQGAAVPRRGLVRACSRLAGARPARRTAAADAVDRRRVPRRRAGDRRAAAVERVLLRMGDLAGAPPRAGYGGRLGDGLAGALALAALAATAALAVLCFVKVDRPRPARAAPAATVAGCHRAPVADAGCGRSCSRWPASSSGVRRGCCSARSSSLAPWPASVPTSIGLHLPSTGSLPTLGIAIDPRGAHGPARALARPPSRGARTDLGLRPTRRACSSAGRARASPSRCGSCSKACCGPSARSPSARPAGRCRRSRTAAGSRSSSMSACYAPAVRLALARCRARAPAADRAARHLRRRT